MGCGESRLPSLEHQMSVVVVDPKFMGKNYEDTQQKMQEKHIHFTAYMSLTIFLQQTRNQLTKHLIVKDEFLQQIIEAIPLLEDIENIIVVGMMEHLGVEKFQDRIQFCGDYQQALNFLTLNHNAVITKRRLSKEEIELIIVKDLKGDLSSQLFIFEETLKIKKISYKIVEKIPQFKQLLKQYESAFVMTTYLYHSEILNIINNSKTKVICFDKIEKYDQQTFNLKTYFLTNNFQEIANEIIYQRKFADCQTVTCSKVFTLSKDKKFIRYGNIIQNFGFKTVSFNNIETLIDYVKYYFAVSVICPDEELHQYEKVLENKKISFKFKIIPISQQTQNTFSGLRKTIKELKKGYRAKKDYTRSIDIIDKFHHNSQFGSLKQMLQKECKLNHWQINCYQSLNCYIKTMKFISPLIICNYNEKSLLYKYLQEYKSKSKIIVYCNKNKINDHLLNDCRFSYVSHSFQKISKYIRNTKIYQPVITNGQNKNFQEKQQKIKNKKQRLSALNNTSINTDNLLKEDQLTFLIVKGGTTGVNLKEITYDASNLFKLSAKPLNNIEQFKKKFINSLEQMIKIHKIKISEQLFSTSLERLQSAVNFSELIEITKQFFVKQNEIGIRLNKSLKKIEKLNKDKLDCLKQIVYLMNLNYLSPYKFPKFQRYKLVHWSKQRMHESCQVGSLWLNKNYLITYDQENLQEVENQTANFIRIEIQLEYNSVFQSNFMINSFFRLDNKLIFAPYSLFKFSNISKENKQTVVTLEYRKNIDFTKYYFQENLLEKEENLMQKFEKETKQPSNQLVAGKDLHIMKENLKRCRALKHFKTGESQKAIQTLQKIMKQEEDKEDFNIQRINQIHFELICYYQKIQNHEKVMMHACELNENSPSPFIRKECSRLIQIMESKVQKEKDLDKVARMTNFCNNFREEIQRRETSQFSSESSENEQEIQNWKVPCIEIDDLNNQNHNNSVVEIDENFS